MNQKKYLFILSNPFSGSTLLLQLLNTSKNVSVFHSRKGEGQFLPELKLMMRDNPWDEKKRLPWTHIKKVFEKNWDMQKSVLLEKSPPNMLHALEIEKEFENSHFLILIRNPYAWCYSVKRRHPNPILSVIVTKWVNRARYQMRNIKNLERVLLLTYEQLCDFPKETVEKIGNFLPELNDINIHQEFQIHSLIGKDKKPISNLNDIAISNLTPKDVNEISDILKKNEVVMKFFSYDLM